MLVPLTTIVALRESEVDVFSCNVTDTYVVAGPVPLAGVMLDIHAGDPIGKDAVHEPPVHVPLLADTTAAT